MSEHYNYDAGVIMIYHVICLQVQKIFFQQCNDSLKSWWRHQMEAFSALLALCARNSPVTCEFPIQRPVMRSFDVFFDLRLNKRLSIQSRGWWFETPSCSFWRHCYVFTEMHRNKLRQKCINQMTFAYQLQYDQSTTSLASDKKFASMTTLLFQWLWRNGHD